MRRRDVVVPTRGDPYVLEADNTQFAGRPTLATAGISTSSGLATKPESFEGPALENHPTPCRSQLEIRGAHKRNKKRLDPLPLAN